MKRLLAYAIMAVAKKEVVSKRYTKRKPQSVTSGAFFRLVAVFLISLAVSVYFAELIRAVIPINLLLLLILVHIVYVLIRWYVKGCMRSRGYY